MMKCWLHEEFNPKKINQTCFNSALSCPTSSGVKLGTTNSFTGLMLVATCCSSLVKMTINRNEVKEGQVALLLGIPCYVCYDFQRVTCLVGALLSQGEQTGETNETSEASKKNPTSKIHPWGSTPALPERHHR